LDKHFVDKMKI